MGENGQSSPILRWVDTSVSSSRSTYVRARGDAGAGREGTAASQQHGKRDTDSAIATTRALDALRAACAPLRQLQRDVNRLVISRQRPDAAHSYQRLRDVRNLFASLKILKPSVTYMQEKFDSRLSIISQTV